MSKYDLNTETFLTLLPHALRKPRVMSLVRVLLAPVAQLHASFLRFKTMKDYRLAHSGQVFSLEQVVCDFCNNSGCYITDGEIDTEVLIPFDATVDMANYQRFLPYDSTSEPQLLIRYEGRGFDTYADFIVHLPSALHGQIDEPALCTLIDSYKVAGKFYRIVYDSIAVVPYSFAWSGDNCVLVKSVSYTFLWSGENCVMIEKTPYSFAWSGDNCVKVENKKYSFAWSGDNCVKIEKKTEK